MASHRKASNHSVARAAAATAGFAALTVVIAPSAFAGTSPKAPAPVTVNEHETTSYGCDSGSDGIEVDVCDNDILNDTIDLSDLSDLDSVIGNS